LAGPLIGSGKRDGRAELQCARARWTQRSEGIHTPAKANAGLEAQIAGIRFSLRFRSSLVRRIVAGRAKGRIAFKGTEHGADFLSFIVPRAIIWQFVTVDPFFLVTH
jgi:hypothetical protein